MPKNIPRLENPEAGACGCARATRIWRSPGRLSRNTTRPVRSIRFTLNFNYNSFVERREFRWGMTVPGGLLVCVGILDQGGLAE